MNEITTGGEWCEAFAPASAVAFIPRMQADAFTPCLKTWTCAIESDDLVPVLPTRMETVGAPVMTVQMTYENGCARFTTEVKATVRRPIKVPFAARFIVHTIDGMDYLIGVPNFTAIPTVTYKTTAAVGGGVQLSITLNSVAPPLRIAW